MFPIINFLKKRVDAVFVLIFLFVFSLIILFAYQQYVNTDIEKNDKYILGVIRLASYNQEIDNIMMKTYRDTSTNKIIELTKAFYKELLVFKSNKTQVLFDDELYILIEELRTQYSKKVNLVEGFKTLNAKNENLIYYLYELQGAINREKNGNIQIEKLLRDILFKVGQVFIGKEVKVLYLDRDLLSLNLHRSGDINIDYFYQSTKQLLANIELLNKYLKENEILDLDLTIESLDILLERKLQYDKKMKDMIGFIFFIFSLIILIILVYTYSRVRKNRVEIFYLAYHDTLTKLPNREKFENYMNDLIARKSKDKKRFIILFIDLDRFKVINDTLGHDVGDKMLIVLAKRISKMLEKDTLLARIGGDEFVAIVENGTKIDEIDILAAELASVIRNPIHIGEYSLHTSASIGIAKYPEDGENKSTLLKHADSAMYHAKENGGDTYAFYTKELSIAIQRRLELEQELVNALKSDEFSLVFQPQYYLQNNKITGAEALTRWYNPRLGHVSPNEFILVAEEIGLIVDLGYFIFRRACQTYMEWKERGIVLHLMAINISSVQLHQSDFLKNIKIILDETGMQAKNIEIELTERFIVEYSRQKLSILDDLRSLGCRVSIDDFGTGYSSFSYLRNLKVDSIKIDKSFIDDIVFNKHDAKVVKAMIVLSQSLGYRVIAEGVETIEQEEIIKSYDCDMAQGYYFAKPMDSETFIGFFKKNVLYGYSVLKKPSSSRDGYEKSKGLK